jgi:hypothetical protein
MAIQRKKDDNWGCAAVRQFSGERCGSGLSFFVSSAQRTTHLAKSYTSSRFLADCLSVEYYCLSVEYCWVEYPCNDS